MFAQEPPPDFDVPGRREPGERPELVAEVGLVEVACATGEVAPVDRSGGTEAINGLIELHRRVARGFRNRKHYRLRMLLIGGGLSHPHLR